MIEQLYLEQYSVDIPEFSTEIVYFTFTALLFHSLNGSGWLNDLHIIVGLLCMGSGALNSPPPLIMSMHVAMWLCMYMRRSYYRVCACVCVCDRLTNHTTCLRLQCLNLQPSLAACLQPIDQSTDRWCCLALLR